MIYTEEQEQILVFAWARLHENAWPELRLLHHIPNGGKRTKSEAARFKRAGVKAGVPDICLPVSRQGFHGLYVELKAEKGKVSDHQANWLYALQQQGYQAVVCYGADAAIGAIKEYLGITRDGVRRTNRND